MSFCAQRTKSFGLEIWPSGNFSAVIGPVIGFHLSKSPLIKGRQSFVDAGANEDYGHSASQWSYQQLAQDPAVGGQGCNDWRIFIDFRGFPTSWALGLYYGGFQIKIPKMDVYNYKGKSH